LISQANQTFEPLGSVRGPGHRGQASHGHTACEDFARNTSDGFQWRGINVPQVQGSAGPIHSSIGKDMRSASIVVNDLGRGLDASATPIGKVFAILEPRVAATFSNATPCPP